MGDLPYSSAPKVSFVSFFPSLSSLTLVDKGTDGRTSHWLCFMGWEDPREKCFHFPEPLCALLHGALSLSLSPFTSRSLSLSEQMEHILCSLSALLALRKYYNKADMPCVRTDLICQWHLSEFVNCSVLQPCQRVSFIVSGPVNTSHPRGLPAERRNNECKAI